MSKNLIEHHFDDIGTKSTLLFDGKNAYYRDGQYVLDDILINHLDEFRKIYGVPQQISNGALSDALFHIFSNVHDIHPNSYIKYVVEVPEKLRTKGQLNSKYYYYYLTHKAPTWNHEFREIENMEPRKIISLVRKLKLNITGGYYQAYANEMERRELARILINITPENYKDYINLYGIAPVWADKDLDFVIDSLISYESRGVLGHNEDYDIHNPLRSTNRKNAQEIGMYNIDYSDYVELYPVYLEEELKIKEPSWRYYDLPNEYAVSYGNVLSRKKYSLSEITASVPDLDGLKALLMNPGINNEQEQIDRILRLRQGTGFKSVQYLTNKDYLDNLRFFYLRAINGEKSLLFNFLFECYMYIYWALGLDENGKFENKDISKRMEIENNIIRWYTTYSNFEKVKEFLQKKPIIDQYDNIVLLSGTDVDNLYDLALNFKICVKYKGFYLHWISRSILLKFMEILGMKETLNEMVHKWLTIEDNRSEYGVYPMKDFDLNFEEIPLYV